MTATPHQRFKTAYPFQDLLGFRKTEFAKGFASFELDLQPAHMNLAGIPHGGVYTALLDTALGSAGCYLGEDNRIQIAVTLNLNVSFLAPPRGKRLTAEGRTVGGGRKIYFSEGAITDETGVIVARASGTFKVTGPRAPN